MGLTPEEDADLRRLVVFERAGFLTPEAAERLADLRSRDRRSTVRPAGDVAWVANAPHLGRRPRAAACSVYPDDPRLELPVQRDRAAADVWHRRRAVGH
jgi:hypothetical protein